MLSLISSQLEKHLDPRLVRELLRTYKEIKDQYFLGRHEPSELNGGKFCEVVYRILEYITSGGNFTPLGRHIPRLVEKLWHLQDLDSSKHNESVRVHIPRVLVSIYEIRNKRGVGHVGGDVNPNFADSTYIAAAADWVIAEFLRLYYGCTLDEAQRTVDGLVQRKVSVVHDYGDVKRVLNPRTKYPDQVLLLLASAAGGKLTEDQLVQWTEHSNPTVFRRDVLGRLHKKRLVEWRDGNCTISPTGLRQAEGKHGRFLAELNSGVPEGSP
jgi:hypothetical protein